MHNELFSIGPITVYGYGTMIAIGVLCAYFCAVTLARRTKLDPDAIFGIFVVSAVSGVVGAKVLYDLTILDKIIQNPRLLLDFANGFVVYGGLIAGIAAGILYCRKKKLPWRGYLDCAAPSIALGQGFGRIGCFLAGCCYGIQTDGPIAVTFHTSQFAPNGVPLFPTQLFSSAFDFLHCLLLCLILKRRKRQGTVGACYVIIYSIGRFAIEFFRGDTARGAVGLLSTSQFISIFTAIAGGAMLLYFRRREKIKDEIPYMPSFAGGRQEATETSNVAEESKEDHAAGAEVHSDSAEDGGEAPSNPVE